MKIFDLWMKKYCRLNFPVQKYDRSYAKSSQSFRPSSQQSRNYVNKRLLLDSSSVESFLAKAEDFLFLRPHSSEFSVQKNRYFCPLSSLSLSLSLSLSHSLLNKYSLNRPAHITAFSACVYGRQLRFQKGIANFLSLI